MAGYVRQSTADIIPTATVRAAPINAEYNALRDAFAASGGHKHDGTSGEGEYVPLIADLDALNKVVIDTTNNRVGVFVEVSAAAVEQIRIQDGVIVPVTDNDIDLGTSSVEFKDLYLDGTAYIDTLAVHESATITSNFSVNGNTTLGNAASDTVTFTADIASAMLPSADNTHDLGAVGSEWRNLYIDGTANIDALIADTATISAGTIDNTVIGGSTAVAGSFSTISSSGATTLASLTVSGATALNGGLTLDTNKFTVADTTGNTAIAGTLDVTGATTVADFTATGTTVLPATSFGDNNITNVGNIALDSITADGSSITITGNTTFADGAYDFDVASHDGSNGLKLAGTLVTSSAAELNKLDGATVTTTEINILDGDNSATSTTVADADRVVMNDNGTMVQVAVTDLAAYFDDEITAMPNLVTTAATTVGALNSGSITSGFGSIDTGSSTITTTGNITGGNVIISDGGNIGSASDTDAIAIASNGNVTLSQNLTVSGDLQVDGTTTTVNSNNLSVDDQLIELGNGRTGSATGDSGIVIERGSDANAFIGFDESADKFTVGTGTFTGTSTGDLSITTGTLVANIEGNVTGDLTGNADTATALETARTIAGQSFDGTANINIATTDLTSVTATAAEVNIMDGDTTATSTTLADADRVVVNDAGTMKQVALTDFETYFESALDTLSNVTTVGTLNSGSITSGFGSIDNGSSAITTTGTITFGTLSDGSDSVTDIVTSVGSGSANSELPTALAVENRIQAINSISNNVSGLNATGAELNAVADVSAITIDTSTAIANNDGIAVFDSSASAIGYFDVDLLDTYFAGTTKTLTNKTLTSPTVSGLYLSDAGFIVEGSSADGNESTVTFTNPTADRTITFPDATGTVALSGATQNVDFGTVTADGLTVDGDITATGDTFSFTSANAEDPLVILKNTTNDANSARLRFVKDKGAAGADGDDAGEIEFYADNDAQEQILFARIKGEVKDASDGAEGGRFKFQVASHDGEMITALSLSDGNAEDEVDVVIGNGSDSITEVSGSLGIGTSSPAANRALHVRSTAQNQARFERTGSSTSHIEFSDSTTTNQPSLGGVGDSLTFRTGFTEAMQIDSSQRVLINGVASTQIRTRQAVLQSNGTSSDAGASFTRWTNGGGGPYLTFAHSRSATVNGGFTILQDGDTLGSIDFAGADGTDLTTPGATITASVDGTPGANDMPGRLTFSTTADGGNGVTERMRIDNSGRVGIGTNAISGYNAYGDGLVVKKSSIAASSGMTIQAPANTGYSSLYFGDPDDTKVGGLEYSHNLDGMFLISGNSTAMVLDSSQRVLIGHTSAQTFSLTPQVSLLGTDASSSAYQVGRFQNGAFASYYQFAKSRATTVGNHVIVQDDDTIGNIRALADDGVNYDAVAASIEFAVDGTPGVNDMPGRLVFSTSADGSDSPTERMRITNNGRVGINTVGESGAPTAWLTIDNDINSANVLTNKSSYHIALGVDGGVTDHYIGGIGFGDVTQTTIQAAISAVDNGTSAATGLAFATGNISSVNEAMRIDSSQRVLIGSTSATNSVTPLNLKGSAGGVSGNNFVAGKHGNDNYQPAYTTARSRGSEASPTSVLVNDGIAAYNSYGYDGSSYIYTGGIQMFVDGDSGTNDMPSRLSLYTTSDGAASATERMRITNDGKVNISSTGGGIPGSQLQVSYSDSSTTHSAQGQVPNGLRMYNANTGTNVLTSISFAAPNAGTALASINMVNLNAQSASTLCLGDLTFSTKANGSSTQSERMRIKADGKVGIGTDNPQNTLNLSSTSPQIRLDDTNATGYSKVSGSSANIYLQADEGNTVADTKIDLRVDGGTVAIFDGDGLKFNGDTAAANALDDYEEGTWTPTYSFDGGGTVTTTNNTGKYVKIGSLVQASFKLRSTGVSGVSGNLRINGLPFTISSEERSGGSPSFMRNWAEDMPNFRLYPDAGTTYIVMYWNATNSGTRQVDTTEFSTGADNNVLEAHIIYQV